MKKILFIEDDQILVRMYTQKLQGSGFEVKQTADSKSALSLCRDFKPDLIVLDIMLPGGINGFDVLELLKNDQEVKNIPVIVLTNLETEKESALKVGASDYIIKSENRPEAVIDKIKSILWQKS